MDLINLPEFNENGLMPVIVQDCDTREILMLAWTNLEALQLSLETGQAHFWSRSRKTLWHKGATSGNFQEIHEILIDCDQDTLLFLVKPAGPACHTGNRTCFYRSLEEFEAEGINTFNGAEE